MQFSIWRTISSIGYAFGLVILFVGIYAYLYYETNFIGWVGLSFYSYRNAAIPLIIAGIVLIFLGFFTEKRFRNARNHAQGNEPAETSEKKPA